MFSLKKYFDIHCMSKLKKKHFFKRDHADSKLFHQTIVTCTYMYKISRK